MWLVQSTLLGHAALDPKLEAALGDAFESRMREDGYGLVGLLFKPYVRVLPVHDVQCLNTAAEGSRSQFASLIQQKYSLTTIGRTIVGGSGPVLVHREVDEIEAYVSGGGATQEERDIGRQIINFHRRDPAGNQGTGQVEQGHDGSDDGSDMDTE